MLPYGIFLLLFIGNSFVAPGLAADDPDELKEGYDDYFHCLLDCFGDLKGIRSIDGELCDATVVVNANKKQALTIEDVAGVLQCITGECLQSVPDSVCEGAATESSGSTSATEPDGLDLDSDSDDDNPDGSITDSDSANVGPGLAVGLAGSNSENVGLDLGLGLGGPIGSNSENTGLGLGFGLPYYYYGALGGYPGYGFNIYDYLANYGDGLNYGLNAYDGNYDFDAYYDLLNEYFGNEGININ